MALYNRAVIDADRPELTMDEKDLVYAFGDAFPPATSEGLLGDIGMVWLQEKPLEQPQDTRLGCASHRLPPARSRRQNGNHRWPSQPFTSRSPGTSSPVVVSLASAVTEIANLRRHVELGRGHVIEDML
jgi:hypothetical protein